MAGTQKDHHVTNNKNYTKTVPVTSVTPAIKTEAVSEAQKDRTRKLVATIAASTPAGRVAKGVETAAKAVSIAKKLTPAEKAMVKEVKSVAKNEKPGTVQKLMDSLTPEEKRDYSDALRKAAGNRSGIYKKTPAEVPQRIETKIINPRTGKTITIKEG
jgi:hypothetical protein